MKQGIHPDYHKITVVMTDGAKFETYSTYGKEGDTMQLDVDPKTHPAWIGGGNLLNQKASQVAKFNKRFSGLGMGGVKEEKKEVKVEAKAEEKKAAAPAPVKEAKKEEKKAPAAAKKKAEKKA